MDAVVLLVTSPEVAVGFRAHLEKRGTIVEDATPETAREVVEVATPDIVVAFGSASVIATLDALRSSSNPLPVVAVADWKQHRALRERKEARLGALLPADLPPIALANRVLTLAERAAGGQPLLTTPSIVPPGTERNPGAPKGKAAASPGVSDKGASGTALGAVRRAVSPKVSLALPAKPSLAAPKAAAVATAKAEAVSTLAETEAPVAPELAPVQKILIEPSPVSLSAPTLRPGSIFSRSALSAPSAVSRSPTANSAPLSTPSAATEAVAQASAAVTPEAPPELSRTSQGSPSLPSNSVAAPPVAFAPPVALAPPVASAPPAASPGLVVSGSSAASTVPMSTGLRLGVAATPNPPPAVSARPSPVAEPASRPSDPIPERISFLASDQVLPRLRLALLDSDPTRAGALAQKLHERGSSTQLISPLLESHRWPLLRRFSPHGIVLDERDVARSSRWLEALRSDPFLGTTPLILAPLSRMFDEAEGIVNLAPLELLVSELGRVERALEAHRAPGQELEFELSDIRPYRLLELIAAVPLPSRLTATSEGRELLWSFADGQSGPATLGAAGGKSSLESLTAQNALEWLLSHEGCRVLVTYLPQGANLEATGGSVQALLKAATQSEPIPEVPLRPLSARPPSLRPPGPEASQSSRAAPEGPRSRALGAPGEGPPSAVERAANAWATLGGARQKRTVAITAGGALLLGMGLVFFRSSPPAASSPASQPSRERAQEVAPPPAKTTQPEAQPSDEWAVKRKEGVPSCPELLGASRPRPRDAADLVAQGRKQLMMGSLDEARRLFCASSVADPMGTGPEALAALYLAEHAPREAEKWARSAVDLHPGRGAAVELLGDALSQSGRPSEALEAWLSSLRIAPTESNKRIMVSKNWTRDGQLAEKGGDRPRAERYFRRAAALDPNNALAAVGLTRAFLSTKEFGLARIWANKALALAPEFPEAVAVLNELDREGR